LRDNRNVVILAGEGDVPGIAQKLHADFSQVKIEMDMTLVITDIIIAFIYFWILRGSPPLRF